MIQEEYTNIEQICFVFTTKYTEKSTNVIVKVTKSKYLGFIFLPMIFTAKYSKGNINLIQKSSKIN